MSEFRPDSLTGWHRSHNCGQLRLADVDKQVTIMGWVHRRRDLGGLIFVDLRDRDGLTQIVFNQANAPEAFNKASCLRGEFVIAVIGKVSRRAVPSTTDIATKDIEVMVEELRILNASRPLPVQVAEEQATDEGLRMQYRYLDLRKPRMTQNLILRHRIAKAVRDYLDSRDFCEIETPVLQASTPEGARDYLVPSRVAPGMFYALPQSPQLYKQILMVSGLDKYFQIARCFRDEDLRADRQPEFTQIDMEMSFVEMDDVLLLVEGLVNYLFKTVMHTELPASFRRMSWNEAMESYGSDKPDLRVDMRIQNITEAIGQTEFGAFNEALASGHVIKGFVVKGQGGASRKEQDALKALALAAKLPALFFIARTQDGSLKSSIMKFLGEEKAMAIAEQMGAQNGDLIVLATGESKALSVALGKLRLDIAKKYDLLDMKKFEFLWVVDFPLFSWNEEENKLDAEHHPFTSPLPCDIHLIDSEPLKVRAAAYDLVLNGNELASGSVRIYQREMQEKVLSCVGLSIEEAKKKFGFLLNAFEFGAPPHAGIALGLDRLTAICAGETSIREVIAFPKNTNGCDLMIGAPVVPTQEQLNLLHLEVTK